MDDECLAAICHSARMLFDVAGVEITVRRGDRWHWAARAGMEQPGKGARLAGVFDQAFGCVAEVPITLDDGVDVATLSLFDPTPRPLDRRQAEQLRSLAMVAAAHLAVMERCRSPLIEEPRAEASRYHALTHALPQMIWVMRATDGEAIYVNRRFEEFYGPIGRSAAARLAHNHPDDEACLGRAWDFAKQGRTIEIEGRLRRHDGQYRWHKLVMIPVRSGDAVVEWIGTALDIDEIVRAHRKLEDAQGLLQLAQTAAGAGVWEWMLDLQEVRLSPESARMHGLLPAPGSTDEPVGSIVVSLRRWRQSVHPPDFEGLAAAAETAIRDGNSFTAEFRIGQPPDDGSRDYRWLQTFGQLLRDTRTGRPDRLVGLSLDVTERRRAQSRIEHMALHDGLTALPNRVLFRERLRAAIDQENRFALLLCDLDGFKGVNDTLGHAAGDRLLQVIADRLQSAVRSIDIVARLGGDEFAILLGGVRGRKMAAMAAQRLIEIVSDPVSLDGGEARVGMSVGIAIAGDASVDIDGLMCMADEALYAAKASGRTTHRFAKSRLKT